MGKVKQIKANALASRPAVTRKAGRVAEARAARASAKPATKPGARERSARGRSGAQETVHAAGRTAAEKGGKDRRQGNGARARGGPPSMAPRGIRIRELVPEKVCGPRTRVHQVFRVEERVNGSSQTHLVFNDRHGWYCEHGAECPAVGAVRRRGKS